MSALKLAFHTPGPWKMALDFNLSGRILGDGGVAPIADVLLFGQMPSLEMVANANLIATAPQLLDTCEFILGYLEDGEAVLKCRDQISALRDVIAMAKGQWK